MAQIDEFHCVNLDCTFEMPSGRGYSVHAVADDGERVRCRHPGERAQVREDGPLVAEETGAGV